MVRVLATMILSHTSKASVLDCEHVAKALIKKFLFLKEYVSYIISLLQITYYSTKLGVLGNIYLCEVSEL